MGVFAPRASIAQGFHTCFTTHYSTSATTGTFPVYRGRMSKAHGQDRCEVSVTLPPSPTEPWGMTVIGVELDETVE
jgi:hypothetical protein